jgi:hypothetical protein
MNHSAAEDCYSTRALTSFLLRLEAAKQLRLQAVQPQMTCT